MYAGLNCFIWPAFPITNQVLLQRPALWSQFAKQLLTSSSFCRSWSNDMVSTCLWNHLRKIRKWGAWKLQGFSEGISLHLWKRVWDGRRMRKGREEDGIEQLCSSLWLPAQAEHGLGLAVYAGRLPWALSPEPWSLSPEPARGLCSSPSISQPFTILLWEFGGNAQWPPWTRRGLKSLHCYWFLRLKRHFIPPLKLMKYKIPFLYKRI